MTSWTSRGRIAVATATLLLAATPFAAADIMAYGGKRDLRTEGDAVVVEHHHDWGNKKHPSWVRVVDRTSGRERWRRASPPLDVLWLSPDQKHVVGLSNVKLRNGHQLFIASADGTFLHVQPVRCDTLRPLGIACSESVTNRVHWYHARDPGLELTLEDGRPAAISFNRTEDLACRFAKSPESKERCASIPRRATLRLELTAIR